jgi:hypothetical protein
MDGPPAEHVRTLLRWLKDGPPGAIPIERPGRPPGALVAVTWEDAGDADALDRASRWYLAELALRAGARPVAPETIRRWLQQEILPSDDRVLFWIKGADGRPVGHVGLRAFDFAARTVVVGDLAGEDAMVDPLIGAAMEALARWAKEQLGMTAVGIPSRRAEAA